MYLIPTYILVKGKLSEFVIDGQCFNTALTQIDFLFIKENVDLRAKNGDNLFCLKQFYMQMNLCNFEEFESKVHIVEFFSCQ